MGYYSLVRHAGNAVRLAEVIQILARHGFADMMRRMGVHEGGPAKILRSLHLMDGPSGYPETVATRLRAALVQLGPTFVKVGQILSTRPDLVGVELSKDLQNLQDKVPPLPFEKMRPVIESSLGMPLEQAYAAFNTETAAAASLSCVYRARLHTGEEVAVKVQRPGIRQVIESDMQLLRGIGHWAEEHVSDLSWIDMAALVDEFHRSITRELNFQIEAQVIERFGENFAESANVFIPKVYHALSSEFVLTMDWIDGVRIDAVESFPPRDSSPKKVADLGCDTLCLQVFEHRLFHADPHPGNIFVTRNNQIAFLDFGMVGALEKSDVYAMVDALQAVFEKDTAECVRCFLAFTVSGETDDPVGLERDIADYIAFEAEDVVARGQVGRALEQLITILHRHKLQLTARFSLLLKALVTIESVGHKLDPELDMVPIMRPYLERTIEQRFSPAELMRDVRHDIFRALKWGRELPSDFFHLLRMLRRGRVKIVLTHEKLDHIAGVIDRASNRLTFGVITGSLIVGSSLLIISDTANRLGVAGFTVAGILGLGLLISIIRSRNF